MVEIKLSPIAYMDIYRHCATHATAENFICGLLTGFVEDEIPFVKNYIPLSHSSKAIDFECHHEYFQEIEAFNEENHDPDFISDEIIGWVRSCASEIIDPTESDKKNQLYLQTAYSDNAFSIFLPPSGDQYGMVIKSFNAPISEIDMSSGLDDLDWNFDEIDDMDDLFQIVIELNQKRITKEPLIEEKYEPASPVQKIE